MIVPTGVLEPRAVLRDTICDVYFTEAGYVEAPAGVTWKRYDALEIPAIPYPRVSLRWTVREKHPWRWSWMGRYPGYKDVIELFEGFQSIEMGTNERQSLFNGRERPALIDLELPRRWLRHCLDNDDCCAKLKGEGVRTSVFRLIDTTSKSVVEFDQHRLGDIPYVTLSYVWGTTQQAMLKRENLLRLQLPGSLQGATPQTITDAMMFTSYMGYRYLWVDTLCIIQNDDADKMSQLQIMGDIYKNANFTIVAAAGENSGSGLAGILTPRRAIQRKKQWRSASFLKLEIRPYVLRNTPVRLVEIYDIPEDNMSRTMPFSTNGGESASPLPTHSYPNAFEPLTLDTIYKTLSPDITPKRLSRTPDDQLLFFWCERTYLYLGKPSGDEDTISVHDEEEWERPKYSWKSDRMKVEFIAIASDACPWFALSSNPSQREKQGIEFFLFLIKRRQGIAYRVATIGFVSIEKWLKFKRERILVALG
ncbi:hypothetical protein NCU04734 [Neurospora crassa OR74A]|uniref:Heterokaryon incompatibility domain-containing protein n=1 Tax=Neurospora crassa (strain ATCC 24698 / 74-OR23-1A / CBS 708.71 / DSM 1257 / FGSC 987) TaxID=367110 RepID=Q7S6H1_NEUCR|nr:hypothetical protein NCU04734 [Neurospora crassa OR74A]EAA31133.1 hypothetical protein NCU04734 [Neurospora crassa OR74A]|eukprot:XP_960369.1 hypothetical protein NCU04734 [Neurospora crassa OR74A]